jgi:hypothetical protein
MTGAARGEEEWIHKWIRDLQGTLTDAYVVPSLEDDPTWKMLQQQDEDKE